MVKGQITVAEDRPDSVDAVHLLAELDTDLHRRPYPPESRHAFSIDRLIREGVVFFIIRYESEPAGCGAIKLFGTEYGEVKRMYVRPAFRGLGLGKVMLKHLSEYARKQRVSFLRLETGIYQTEAIALYERFGFQRRAPFGEYKEDPLSVYFEKCISWSFLKIEAIKLCASVAQKRGPRPRSERDEKIPALIGRLKTLRKKFD